MSAILATMNKIAGFVPPIVYAVLVGMFFTWGLTQSWRLDDAHEKLGAAQVAVDQAKNVNDHNVTVVSELTENNAACLDGRRADEQKYITAQASWEGERGALQAKASEVRTHEIEVYRDPTCADLAQLDVSLACPALAVGLRERADRLNEVRDSHERSASSGPDSG